MAGKIVIRGDLEVLTGLHIGGSDTYSAIGAVDSSVIRNPRTGLPIIPGSSLKGKIRSLLARNQEGVTVDNVTEPNDDPEFILRLFGSSEKMKRSRLQFVDSFIKDSFLESNNFDLTEIKTENNISRATAEADLRQIERVVPGTIFEINIVYDIDNPDEVTEDFDNLIRGLKLLQLDYLGGNGTRGSGRVSFSNFELIPYNADPDIDIKTLKENLNEINNYDLFSLQNPV